MATIQKRGDSYRVLIRKKGHAPVSETFKLKAVAERWARETEVAMDAGKFQAKPEDATLSDTIEEYKKRMERMGKPVGKNKLSCLNGAVDALGDKTLSGLTTQVLVDWISGMKVKPSTRQQYVIFLRTALVTAETLWDAQPNMAAYEKAARFMREHGITSESDQRDVRVDDATLAAILEQCRTSAPMADIMWFQVYSAFRIGETLRLRWADLDEQKKTVLIRQRKHPKKKYDEVAPLLGKAWDIASAQPRDGEFIFPHSQDTIERAWDRACERAGIEDVRIHDLRHEGTSRLFEQGYSITEVQLCTGHKDLKSLQRYLKLRPEDLHNGPVAVRRYQEQIAAAGNVVPITRAA